MTRDTTPAPAPLFEPTVADLQQAIEALRESETELLEAALPASKVALVMERRANP